MTNRFRSSTADESGFTLIELLVVVLIIGILAAIALPSFLGQQAKGQDTDAKADARNALSQMETCYIEKSSYVGCDDAMLAAAGIDTTSTTSTKVSGQTADAFVITSISRSKNSFTITKTTGTGVVARACSTTGGTTKGGCNSGSW